MNGLNSDLAWLTSFLLGAAFVVLYATARLRGPEADRSFTTLYRYTVSAVYFATGHLAIYVLALSALWAVDRLDNAGIAEWLLGTPGWLALLTAGVLPRIKPFSILDTIFRAHARHIGGMPDEALRLRDAICEADVTLSEAEFQELHFALRRRGVDIGNHIHLPDGTLHAQLMRAAQLKFLVDKCMRQQRHFTFACDNSRTLEMLTRRFDHLMFRASRSIDAIGHLHELANTVSGKSGNWEALGAMAENQAYAPEATASAIGPAGSTARMLIANLREDTRDFISDVSLILSRMTLRKRWTEGGRVKLLARISLRVEPLARPHFRAVIAVFSVVAACMWVVGFTRVTNMTPGEAINSLVMVSLIFVIGVLCAIYPKQYFGFANVNVYGRPPYLFFFVAGITAALLAFVVGMVFRLIRLQDGQAALLDAWQKSPWLFMTFSLAFTLAVLVQDTRGMRGDRHESRRSLRDALVMGLALALAMGVVQKLLQFTMIEFAAPRYGLMAMGFGLGAFIGFYIPKRFRNVYRPTSVQLQEMERAQPATRLEGALRFMRGSAP